MVEVLGLLPKALQSVWLWEEEKEEPSKCRQASPTFPGLTHPV